MAELENFFDESILRFFENEEEQRPVEEEERAEGHKCHYSMWTSSEPQENIYF